MRLLVLPLVVLLLGCGERDRLNRQAVCGSVTLDGKPLARGAIPFQPEEKTGTSTGAVIEDGRYAIAADRERLPAVIG